MSSIVTVGARLLLELYRGPVPIDVARDLVDGNDRKVRRYVARLQDAGWQVYRFGGEYRLRR